MNEKIILKISLIIVVLGLVFLTFYSDGVELKAVERIDSALPEQEIKLKGIINRLTTTEKVSFIELEGQKVEKTKVILFPDGDIYLKEGDYVELSGTVEEYQGEKEVIANKVTVK